MAEPVKEAGTRMGKGSNPFAGEPSRLAEPSSAFVGSVEVFAQRFCWRHAHDMEEASRSDSKKRKNQTR
jgi:hypothetical protein